MMDSQGYIDMFRRSGNPTINDILNLLQMTNSVPTVQVKNMGALGTYNNASNTLTLSPYGGNTTTVSHELTHALDHRMDDYADKLRSSGAQGLQQQFLDTYQKLDTLQNPSKLIPNQRNLATKDQLNDQQRYDMYRYSPNEVRAFGVGNQEDDGGPGVEPRAHLDATQAQEAAILRDLYRRSLSAPQQQTTPSWIDTLLGMMKRP
jgi:hypothetical protein